MSNSNKNRDAHIWAKKFHGEEKEEEMKFAKHFRWFAKYWSHFYLNIFVFVFSHCSLLLNTFVIPPGIQPPFPLTLFILCYLYIKTTTHINFLVIFIELHSLTHTYFTHIRISNVIPYTNINLFWPKRKEKFTAHID